MVDLANKIEYGKKKPGFWTAFLVMLCLAFTLLVFLRGPDLLNWNPVAPELEFKEQIKQLDYATLTSMTKARFRQIKVSSLSVAVKELNEILQLADQIEQIEPNSEREVRQFRLAAYSILDSYNVELEFEDPKIRDTLMAFANSGLKNEASTIRQQSHFAIITALATDLCKTKQEAEFVLCKKAIDRSLDELEGDKAWPIKLMGLFKILVKGEIPEYRRQLLTHIGRRLAQNEDPEIRALGYQYNSHGLFPASTWLRIDTVFSVEQMDEVLATLQENHDVDTAVFRAILAILERNARTIQESGRDDILETFKNICTQIREPGIQKNILQRTEKLERRWNSVGKPFQFSGTSLDGSIVDQSDFKNVPVLIFYFSFHQKESATAAQMLAESELLRFETENTLRLIGIPVDQPGAGHLDLLKSRFSSSTIMKPGSQAEFNNEFEIDAIPYFMFLNSEHVVVDIAIKENELRDYLLRQVKVD